MPPCWIEAVVLRRQHGRFHDVRDFVEAQHVAAFFAEFADQDVVGGKDAQRHARPVVRHGVQVGQVRPRQGQRHAAQQQDAAGQVRRRKCLA